MQEEVALAAIGRLITACCSLDDSPTLLSVLLPHPHFPPPVPGSVLFDQDLLQRAYSSFYHLSPSERWGGGGAKSEAERRSCRDRGAESQG